MSSLDSESDGDDPEWEEGDDTDKPKSRGVLLEIKRCVACIVLITSRAAKSRAAMAKGSGSATETALSPAPVVAAAVERDGAICALFVEDDCLSERKDATPAGAAIKNRSKRIADGVVCACVCLCVRVSRVCECLGFLFSCADVEMSDAQSNSIDESLAMGNKLCAFDN